MKTRTRKVGSGSLRTQAATVTPSPQIGSQLNSSEHFPYFRYQTWAF